MKNTLYFILSAFVLVLFSACDGGGEEVEKPIMFLEDVARFEGDNGTSTFSFRVKIDKTSEEEITFSYETRDVDAKAGEDYTAVSGTGTIEIGATSTTVDVIINGDEDFEEDEDFEFFISNPTNATITDDLATGTIRNNDNFKPSDDTGYSTPISQPGYTLVWSDEFDADNVNTNDWTFETGANGWGNQELQNYTNGGNVYQSLGKLVIEAKQESANSYTSTRMITKGKQKFKYGRVDIRAKLPRGQGLWPALWMLGENISSVGWPKCGEIDIMELVGHEPNKVHGTAHWANPNGDRAQYGGAKLLSSGEFGDEFHVFSIIWDDQSIKWYLDDTLYNTLNITAADLTEFHEEFFFIFNVAVGGEWPGNPDATTVFPQRMIVDYIRMFQ
jgi:beta-glucanase (GH16 family)